MADHGRQILLVLALAALAGCAQHVHLEHPGRNAPFPERAEAYERLRPVSFSQTTTLNTGMLATSTDYLLLNDGTQVDYPEDLLPLIEPGSPAAKAIDRSVATRETASLVKWTGTTMTVVGAAMFLGSFLFPESVDDTTHATVFVSGIGLVLVGGVVHMIGNAIGNSAARDSSAGFQLFDRALREALDLCVVNGREIVDCANPDTPMAPDAARSLQTLLLLQRPTLTPITEGKYAAQ